VLADPDTASAPLQPPEAVQLVALLATQVRVELLPLVTLLGLALRDTLGGDAAAETVTVADCDAVPPAPVQVSVYIVVVVNAPVFWVPLVDSAPFQPPEALHEVAFVLDQVKVEAAALFIELGVAVSVTVGAAGGVREAGWAELESGFCVT
jgi:hypothetical protein